MNKTVYVLGAGVNKAINTPSTAPMCSPFLLNDFFQVALQMRNGRYSIDLTYDNRLYNYINKYWKKNKADLVAGPFDLEECFTLLELQLNEAEKNNNLKTFQELNTILYTLTSFITEVLSDFQEYGFYSFYFNATIWTNPIYRKT